MMNDIIIMNITTTMTTYIKLQFNDNAIIQISTSSFLFKQSKLLKSIDIDEDNNIPILCSSTYVLDENGTFIFNDKTNLSFMFTYSSNRFLEICKFLDIIVYENKDTSFSEQFIIYVLKYIKEDIYIIQYFMQPEIRSIINYLNYKNINIQILCCTPIFYKLYLSGYKEEVIKYDRIDIYDLLLNKCEYYRYIHKYDNHLTFIVKETQEYKNYIRTISFKLNMEPIVSYNLNKIKELIEYGADVNFKDDSLGNTVLHNAIHMPNGFNICKYLIEQGADVNIQGYLGRTILHNLSMRNNKLEEIKYLVEHGANIHIKDDNGNTALYYASKKNNSETLEYLQSVAP